MSLKLQFGSKVRSAEDAVALIRDGDCITISGTLSMQLPQKVLRALEVRFLTEDHPRDLTWFDPFPTGIPGIEPLSYTGLLKRVIGGWYTPHPRLREMILDNEVEAYLFPLGSMAFWCQEMAAGRDLFLTTVGLRTYLDPRNGGGRLNEVTTEELVSLQHIAGKEYIAYKQLPIHTAIIRGTLVDEEGNLSLDFEHTTMSSLYQALAAKRFGGSVIVQAQRLVPKGEIPARMVVVPGVLVDAIVIDPDQYEDTAMEMTWQNPFQRMPRPPGQVLAVSSRTALKRWMTEGVIDETLAPRERPLTPDVIIGRRATLELKRGDVINIGQGLPGREILPCVMEEELDSELELSIETGHLGGTVNGLGFRANTRALLDTPGIFSFYGSALVSAAFFSMLEFDAQGSVNLLKYGDTWVGPGGSMDIGHKLDKIVFVGTLRAAGLRTSVTEGRLRIDHEGAIARAVTDIQGVCFYGPDMVAEGKEVLYITERAVFRLTPDGIELIEVAPGIDVDRDVLAQMEFEPLVSPELRCMDERIYIPGPMGVKATWA